MAVTKIAITSADIDAGKPRDEERCPAALAMARDLGKPVYVLTNKWAFGHLGPWYESPPELVEFVSHYDCGLSVGPREIALDRSKWSK